MVTIDIAQYPHISEAILSYTDTTDLPKWLLDIKGFIPPNVNLTGLACAFPGLRILRIRTCPTRGYTPNFPVQAPTVVIFASELETGCPDPTPDDFSFDFLDDIEERQAFPDLKGNNLPIADLFPNVLAPSKSLREFVLVLPQYKKGQARGHVPGIFMDHIVAMGTTELFMAYEGCTFTIVGCDEVRPGYNLRNLMANHLRANWRFNGLASGGFGPGKAAKVKENSRLNPVHLSCRLSVYDGGYEDE
ncbi:hypothetical protein CspeluHIS016_0113910 [Cutaneotrichosporon spelunceum]|uniref:Uncharacterized protein n=1 Tax=Cutaneotrichosporon spelunceum TaxID=1672016 RepID=A0AAD3TR19_9TREE|nr:hypothetical protein CspeluHIS016_0113910 [Cutaneotrichosporon spelunceum]